ncbi:MAG: DUF2092 domain-containing protein [Alphaproteobacteria bacterium]|nr:MAG: DUF2092 domain-containing protein [Alphaproteobacteria bacterium]
MTIRSARLWSAIVTLVAVVAAPLGANADEADAKRLLKAMSDYMESQDKISFEFDAVLEVITVDNQKLALASSGSVALDRPGKIRTHRAGGHADIAMFFDGETVTLFGSDLNIYTEISAPGSIDNLINVLRNDYNRPLPAADLLGDNVYDTLMDGVIDVKDLGSGVVGGVECDYLAFRKEDVDWQIWIAQGDQPYPCKYVITSKDVPFSPQFSIQLRDWQASEDTADDDFSFNNTTDATKVDVKDLQGLGSALPGNFRQGDDE